VAFIIKQRNTDEEKILRDVVHLKTILKTKMKLVVEVMVVWIRVMMIGVRTEKKKF